ncbi:hypothetical protein CMV_008012 [Castanea mollissima]|uniref:Dof zinc finger protein n=1 Tax=Castanea mollissima TaxID=60419 RepID=A0A8J4RNB6_9ROSI|nr:hypothetical protein CMV_008012 [Castanea mollissima]
MQQEIRDGEGSEDMKPQSQDQRLTPMQLENQQQQQQPQQPQKCPRCESLNTKFCYYNNYSLSQPRYFCKTCRRYWTQGGTLRNVPVGGGCRKGKRAKTSSSSSSSENSRSQQPQQAVQQQNLTNPPAVIPSNPAITTSPALRTKEHGILASPSAPSIPSISPYYAAGGSSNLSLLQGFSVPSFGSQQHQRQIQQNQFYQMGNRDRNMEHLYPTEETLIQSNRPPTSSQHDWHHGFINNTNNQTASDSALWTMSTDTTTTATGNTNNTNNTGSTLNPSQWPDLPGYGPRS